MGWLWLKVLKVSVQNPVILVLRGDAVVVTEQSCFTHGLFIVMRLPEHKLEEKGLMLDHGLGGFSLSLCSLADRGKAASLRKCG